MTSDFSYDPYERLNVIAGPVPALLVESASIPEDGRLAPAQVSAGAEPDGKDLSPELSWGEVPAGTQSLVVTAFDPDAPTPSGFWHLAAYDIPADTTSLPEGAFTADGAGDGLPAGVKILRNDAGFAGYAGAAPPPGHGDHRYMYVVYAVDNKSQPIPADASPATLCFTILDHVLARGRVTGIFGH